MSVTLLIADDHEVIRRGLASLLAGSDIEIVAEAATGKETVKLAEKHKPDVVLLDVRMPDGDGLGTLEKLRTRVPDTAVVMLSTYDNPTYMARSVALGAADYVLKGSSREDLITTLQAAAAGESPSRTGELRDATQAFAPFVMVRDGQVAGYLTTATMWPMAHGVAATEEDMEALLLGVAAQSEEPLSFLAPIRWELYRWALREGLRAVKPMNIMARGPYQEPRGAWFSNVLY